MLNKSSSKSTTEQLSISAPQQAEGSGVNLGVGTSIAGGGEGQFQISTTGRGGKVYINTSTDPETVKKALEFGQQTLETGFQLSQRALEQSAALAAESTGSMELAQSILTKAPKPATNGKLTGIIILIGVVVIGGFVFTYRR